MPRRPGPDRQSSPRGSGSAWSAAVTACALLLAGCLPVPGSGWKADGSDTAPESLGPARGETGSGTGDGPAPGSVRCSAPLDGPLRAVATVATDGLLDAAGTPVGGSAIEVLHLAPSGSHLLTLGGASGGTSHARPERDPVCAERAVVAPADDVQLRTLAAAWASLEGVPLILDPPDASDPPYASEALLARIGLLGVTELAHAGPPARWLATSDARAVDLLAALTGPAGTLSAPSGGAASTGAVPTWVVAAASALAGAVAAATTDTARDAGEERAHPVALVAVLSGDVAAQADLVAHVRRGHVPVVLPAEDERAVAVLTELVARASEHDVRWTASSLAHARDLEALLAATPGTDTLEVVAVDARAVTVASGGELWLGDVRDPVAALQAAVAAATRGATFVAVDGAELRSGVERTERMRAAVAAAGASTVVLVGAREDHSDWQLATVLTGSPLPGGGFLPLEEHRIVALYGTPGTAALGLLGGQDDVATIALAREYAAGYEGADDGRSVVPGLDVIATVASSSAEPTGDYSRRVPITRLRPLVDLAREEGLAVILDLQPGRTDFLTQAQEYAELLREPHVHLALDPEWRIGPQERHLRRIGSVEAAEVQAVADWLATLVRDELLPQKVLMLHQFTLGMLPDRDTVVIPPELIGVVHMDGQGSLPSKERTYATITAGAAEQWAWGWKNFTRIDEPLADPERTLARVPVPVIVSNQ